jgi:triosephosphate isomerase
MSEARTPVFAANWKMYKGPTEAAEYVAVFRDLYAPRSDRKVVFFPPAISVPAFARAAAGRPDLEFGVQDVHQSEQGAHTGSISAHMAVQAEAAWALAGHSERRREFDDDDGTVGYKVLRILEAGLRPVLCVGETLEERERGELGAVLARQVEAVLANVAADWRLELTYAYEPVWAIGTGRTASPADAADAHTILRREIERFGGAGAAGSAVVLYGGSVNPSNIGELMAAPGVDGVLVGGASLDAEAFAAICNCAVG